MLLAAVLVALTPSLALAHDGHDHDAPAKAVAQPKAATKVAEAPPIAAAIGDEPQQVEEPVLPGIDIGVDYDVAPNGDIYIAHQDGRLVRYKRAAGSTLAHPSYSLTGELIYEFPVTRQFDRGLVGISIDSKFDSGYRFIYAIITRGSNHWVDNAPDGNPAGIRRTGAVIKIAVPASGPADADDLTTIVGADAPANPDQSCKPHNAGFAPPGQSDALPNGVLRRMDGNNPTVYSVFGEQHIFPDGNLATRTDGAYDCIPSDSSTHGMGDIHAADDGSIFFSVGDASAFDISDPASLRAFNLESYAGKILRVDRNGKGVAGHPFCQAESDKSRICTKVWVRGLRNAFRIGLLPPDGASNGAPVVAVGDVGNWTKERLTVSHPGDNLGWPCWEGTYWAYAYASPQSQISVNSMWGGPELAAPAGAGRTSCERLTAGQNGTGRPTPAGVKMPTVEYEHEQNELPPVPQNGAAITSPGRLSIPAGSDPEVALPASWNGSLIFGDFVRSWLFRLSPDAQDPSNADLDGGVRTPADEGRIPNLQTDTNATSGPDPLLSTVAAVPPLKEITDDEGKKWYVPIWNRVTSRSEADGTVWSLRYADANLGGLWRIRNAPAVEASISVQAGECATGNQTQGNIVLAAADAGPGVSYSWDINGDGLADSGRTSATTTITPAQLTSVKGWVRLTVTRGTAKSVDAFYLCAVTPKVEISTPADNTQVVLDQPITVTATRTQEDRDKTEIPDSSIRWYVETVHGASHQHTLTEVPLVTKVDGQDKLQITFKPDGSHELGSYTRVRARFGGVAASESIRLQPKPVDVTFKSEPAGARFTIRRDVGESVVESAPGTVRLAAGFSTQVGASRQFTDADGTVWYFQRWSDGVKTAARPWGVRATTGDAPIAEYALTQPPEPEPEPEPSTPQGDPPPSNDPPAKLPDPPVLVMPPTALELRSAPLKTSASGKKKTVLAGSIDLNRKVDAAGIVVKVAVRDTRCRWWVFGKKKFAKVAKVKGSKKKACTEPKTWKKVAASWSADGVLTLKQSAGKRLPKGRYAIRVRVYKGTTVLADRLRSVTVR